LHLTRGRKDYFGLIEHNNISFGPNIFGIIVGRVCFIRKAVFAARFGDFIGNHYILFVLIEVVELFVKCIVIGTNSSVTSATEKGSESSVVLARIKRLVAIVLTE
jgi:hypothetical protein